MQTREELIRSLNLARVKGVVIPTEMGGRKVFVKTTKRDIVQQIRAEFKEDKPISLRFRIDEETDLAVIEPSRGRHMPVSEAYTPPEAGHLPSGKKRGRPKGLKNKPKEEPVSEENTETETTVEDQT